MISKENMRYRQSGELRYRSTTPAAPGDWFWLRSTGNFVPLSRLRLRDLEVSSAVYYDAIALCHNQSMAASCPPISLGPRHDAGLGGEAPPVPLTLRVHYAERGMGAGEGPPFPKHCNALGSPMKLGDAFAARGCDPAKSNRSAAAKTAESQKRSGATFFARSSALHGEGRAHDSAPKANDPRSWAQPPRAAGGGAIAERARLSIFF